MFPIRNIRGNIIGFGGRLIVKGEPKYLNSPETTLFSKGNELYGMWEARAGIRSEAFVLVVEGYMDVVGLAQHGLANAVATLGTATSPPHIQKLLRASDKIVFSFDGDQAGRRAAWRALNTCLPLVRDDVSMRFLFLPAQHDPDSYIKEFGAEAFRACAAEAEPLSRFMLDELASRHAMHEAEGRAACVHEARPLLALLPQGNLRLQIEREFAKLVQLTPEELAQMMNEVPLTSSAPGSQAGQSAQAGYGTHAPQGGHASHQAQYDDEPPGFMETFAFDAGYEPVDQHGRAAGLGGPSAQSRPANGGRHRQARAVTPMAKRLLRLLLAHPQLVSTLGDQQLEILEHGPHLFLVRDLIALINVSGAKHAGALLQAAEPGSDLGMVLQSLTPSLLMQDDLPDPQTEWNDALRRIELEAIKAEQSALVGSGLKDDASRRRYQELTRRIALLSAVSSRN
jgi:DNA primase